MIKTLRGIVLLMLGLVFGAAGGDVTHQAIICLVKVNEEEKTLHLALETQENYLVLPSLTVGTASTEEMVKKWAKDRGIKAPFYPFINVTFLEAGHKTIEDYWLVLTESWAGNENTALHNVNGGPLFYPQFDKKNAALLLPLKNRERVKCVQEILKGANWAHSVETIEKDANWSAFQKSYGEEVEAYVTITPELLQKYLSKRIEKDTKVAGSCVVL